MNVQHPTSNIERRIGKLKTSEMGNVESVTRRGGDKSSQFSGLVIIKRLLKIGFTFLRTLKHDWIQ